MGGSLLWGAQPEDRRLRTRDGLLAVGLAWAAASVFGCIPYVLPGALGPVDALFESVAGFTTTGSTVMTQIEGTPRVAKTAKRLWLIYLGITLLEMLLLMLAGMGPFDAICHSPTSVSTGGYATTDFEVWPSLALLVLLQVMVLGAMAGFDQRRPQATTC